MRIERLHIDGFGHYHDREFGPLDNGLTLIRGDNEAGKSTLLAFVRAVLFGFPTRGGAQHYPPLRGGRHGGRITLRVEDGRRLTVQRHQGTRRGPFEARAEDGSVLSEAQFHALIGNTSETLFRDAYTFDLDDLVRFDTSGGDLGGLLYGVSIGAERLPRTLSRLDARIDDLFKPSGSNQVVAGLLRNLEETDARLREVATQAVDYRRFSERRIQIAGELEATEERLAAISAQQQALERHHRAWEDWNILHGREQDLAALEDTAGFPPNAIARLEQAEHEIRAAEVARVEAERDLEAAREAASQEIPDAALLDYAETINGLISRRGAVGDSLRDLPERRAELRSREDDLARRLAELGPGWDEGRLLTFDLSIPRRAEIEGWQQRLDAARTEEAGRTRDVEEARRALDDAQSAHRDAEAERERLADAPDHAAIRARADGLRQLRTAHDTHERARIRAADLESTGSEASPPGQRSLNRGVLLSLAVTGVALLVVALVAFVAGVQTVALGLAAVGGGVFVASLALLLVGRAVTATISGAPRPSGSQAAATAALESAQAVLRRVAADLFGDADSDAPAIDLASIEAAEAALERDRPLADARTRAERAIVDTARTAERAQQRLTAAEQALEVARTSGAAAQREWEVWLTAADFPANLSPRTADSLLATVDAARTRAEEVQQWRHRVDAIEEDISQYRVRVEPVARALDWDTEWPEGQAAVQAADALVHRFEAASREQVKREQACATAEERERAHLRTVEQAAAVREGLDHLLQEGGVTSPEHFRRRAEVHEQRHALERERSEALMRLRQIVGPDPAAMNTLDAGLRVTSREAIETDLEAIQTDLATVRDQRDELVDERGRVAGDLERLHDDETATEARARAAALEPELLAVARDWSAAVLARALLQRTRERYERERQPAVIQRASDFFRTLTNDRYARLYQSLDDGGAITVEDRDGAPKTPEHLSRGTKEQLYLALRLGAIEEAATNQERLPVVVDEVLVNFDETRAARAVQAFVDLSQRTQVVVFTCHPWIAALFDAASDSHRTIPLD